MSFTIPFSLSKFYQRVAVRTCCDCGCWPCRCCRCCCCCWRSTYLSNPPEYCYWPSSVFQELSRRRPGKHVTADLLVFVTNFPGRRPVIAPDRRTTYRMLSAVEMLCEMYKVQICTLYHAFCLVQNPLTHFELTRLKRSQQQRNHHHNSNAFAAPSQFPSLSSPILWPVIIFY